MVALLCSPHSNLAMRRIARFFVAPLKNAATEPVAVLSLAATRPQCRGLFDLFRQDTHGNTIRVSRYDSKNEAEAELDRLSEEVHKQHYWVAPSSNLIDPFAPVTSGEPAASADTRANLDELFDPLARFRRGKN